MAQETASADIFGAHIATTAPAASFLVRKDHPVPRVGIDGPTPIGTNKFYANFFLGKQTSPAYVHPYSLAWARGQGASSSWGMAISHVDANQRVYGPVRPETGAVRYYLNPIGIQSLCLSAAELGYETRLTADNLASHSVNVNLHPSSEAQPMITFPIVQGMGFVTARYRDGTPPEVSKYTFGLEDGKVWHLYSYAERGDDLDLEVVNNGLARSRKLLTGFIQVAKDTGNLESLLDAQSASYPVGVTLSGTISGTQGSYTFDFQKAGDTNTKLLMYALPHHVASFDTETKKAVTEAQLQTTTKGRATAMVADSWTMVEPNIPVSMNFAPWDPQAGPKDLSDEAIYTISPVALKEISQNVDQQANQSSMYFNGKALAKFAQLSYTIHDMLKNSTMAQSGLDNLKAAFARFSENKQQFPLYYENFGNTYYNDHHFHYGYFVYAAAIIGYLDPSWLTEANIDFVNSLVRDIANPSKEDKYFPVSRNFDWYHGHSWAHGLYDTLDGKAGTDQESSSEDAMHAYAIKMWGRTINDANMEARVAGILFENKCDHTTYFGANIEYIQGIHMLPLLPSTKLTRQSEFVKQEWATYFDNGRAQKVEGGWKGILYANLATIDPRAAWDFFTDKNFDPAWLDGGASLTWYLAYCAAFM
ncbi:hypothetical protein DL766_006123 [Monosporascus sp. MC13-8B]|uniref:glucan endo-1,3-beta-D-glucosidase n=1 Tax=Monosporascus cannonballus TaxID=155416 RepID=A0ABY0HEW9_9PEZI|nr:hypothetical protein DL762_001944 [Monosporascus cannonballus]RYO91990.1 hypothetical protein DL763_004834 [Monosporascus cannonballus]RYP27994.1 hypothetical protein DL766_006123 [Monosporascus sp. MC13-8B]